MTTTHYLLHQSTGRPDLWLIFRPAGPVVRVQCLRHRRQEWTRDMDRQAARELWRTMQRHGWESW